MAATVVVPRNTKRLSVFAEQVKYFAGNLRQTISDSWDLVCEIVAQIQKVDGVISPEMRKALEEAIERLHDAKACSERLAYLPVSLDLVLSDPTFTLVVENFWKFAHRRMKATLLTLGDAPTAIDETQYAAFQEIVIGHRLLQEMASLTKRRVPPQDFPDRVVEFVDRYKNPLIRRQSAPMATSSLTTPTATPLTLDDPEHADRYIDNDGMGLLFGLFTGKRLKSSGVSTYWDNTPGEDRGTRGTSWMTPPVAKAKNGRKKNLHHLPVVIEWFRANQVPLSSNPDIEVLPENLKFFFASKDEVDLRSQKVSLPLRKKNPK